LIYFGILTLSPLHILVIYVSFNSKTLGFLHLLFLFFVFISSPSPFNNKNPRKIPEENEDTPNVFELKLTEMTKMCNREKVKVPK